MASTATFKFGLQISKSHGLTKGGGRGVRGLSSKGLLKGPFFATLPKLFLPSLNYFFAL